MAECVARLGLAKDITFISAVGDDAEKSEIVLRSLKRVGIVILLLVMMYRTLRACSSSQAKGPLASRLL